MAKIYKMPKRKLALNTIYCADNLEVMKQMPGESIDLIYIDPPFCTQAVQKSRAWDNEVQTGSFDDKWGGGINSYILWLSVRLREMHRLLKPTGSLFVHLDYRAVHYIKVELDRIFGDGNLDKGAKHLINEIIWYYTGAGTPKDRFSKRHDNILWYGKDKKKWTFNADQVRIPYAEATLKRFKNVVNNVRNGIDFGPQSLNPKGKHPDNVFLISIIPPSGKERLGYPTQKPLALLEKIIKAASNKGDVVADFFCGCATTISAAHSLNRKWIGVDASKQATTVIRQRMTKEHNLEIDITPLKSLTKNQIMSLDPFEFEKYTVRCISGIPNDIQVGDGGIDGRLEDGTPIQVKKSDHIGRPVIDSFHKHLEHNGRGIIIAKSFGRGAKEEVAKLLLEKGWEITLMTVDDILRDVA